MNTKMSITRNNIHRAEARIHLVLTYLHDWYNKKEERKVDKNQLGEKIWEKSVICSITIYNMFLGAIGFIEYVRMILRRFKWVTCVPMSHSNTSSLELHFSLMRFLKADTTANYERTFNAADNEKSM